MNKSLDTILDRYKREGKITTYCPEKYCGDYIMQIEYTHPFYPIRKIILITLEEYSQANNPQALVESRVEKLYHDVWSVYFFIKRPQ